MIFYNLFICLLSFGLKVFSWFNEKAKKGVDGRKESLKIVQEKLKNQKVIWMHSASLGEYEQGLPVLEKLKNEYPDYKILVTFFSPSGYENVVKKQHIADAVCYLPFDKKSTIQEFISQFDTKIFFTVKYDFWYHLLCELHRKGTKIFVVSALFYEKQIFFKPYGKWFANELKKNVDWFFHQTPRSEQLAKNIGLEQSSISGDTRFDRVKQIQNRDNFVEFIQEFKGDKPLVVFGSSWKSEEKIADEIADKIEAKIIIAPHDIKRNIEFQNEKQILKYSEWKTKNAQEKSAKILIIDCIGLLSKIYSYADLAVVGGGFHDKGLHNILEAATFGVPVIFGNHYKKNPEAGNLIRANGGKSFENEKETSEFIIKLLKDKTLLHEMSEKARGFVNSQPNATEIILQKIRSYI